MAAEFLGEVLLDFLYAFICGQVAGFYECTIIAQAFLQADDLTIVFVMSEVVLEAVVLDFGDFQDLFLITITICAKFFFNSHA